MLAAALEEGLGPAHDVLNGTCVERGAQFVLELLHRKNYIEYSNNTHTAQIKDYSLLRWFRWMPASSSY